MKTPHYLALFIVIACSPNALAVNLVYGGGPVISNAHIVSVLYGAATYHPAYITANVTNPISMASFFTDVMASAYMSWLSEYNTPTQSIGLGTYDPVQRTITPSVQPGNVYDSTIRSDIITSISSGALPRPTENTIYVVFFSSTWTPGAACINFCAYHGAIGSSLSPNGHIQYAVMPDYSASVCQACGQRSAFENTCTAVSHEVVEDITDPTPSNGWNDPDYGEIGDICNFDQSSITTANGRIYTVQTEWSNALQACIVDKTPPTTTSTTTTVAQNTTGVGNTTRAPTQTPAPPQCRSNSECNNGDCDGGVCWCFLGYVTVQGMGPCTYALRLRETALVLLLFHGTGAPRFYLGFPGIGAAELGTTLFFWACVGAYALNRVRLPPTSGPGAIGFASRFLAITAAVGWAVWLVVDGVIIGTQLTVDGNGQPIVIRGLY